MNQLKPIISTFDNCYFVSLESKGTRNSTVLVIFIQKYNM